MIDLAAARIERLLPDRAETNVAEQLAAFDPASLCTSEDRPYTFTNFAVTVDGLFKTELDDRGGPLPSVEPAPGVGATAELDTKNYRPFGCQVGRGATE